MLEQMKEEVRVLRRVIPPARSGRLAFHLLQSLRVNCSFIMKIPHHFPLSPTLVIALLAVTSVADTLKQPAPFTLSNTGDLYSGTGIRELGAPGVFTADFQPFQSSLGTLISFTVGCRISGKLQGVAGMEGQTGSAGCAMGGTFTIGGLAFNGTGGLGSGEAAAGEPLEVAIGIPDFETSLTAANAGVSYDPQILELLTGSNSVPLAFSTGVMVNFTNVRDLGADIAATLTLTYTYEPVAGGAPASYSVTRITRPPGTGDVGLAWQSTPGTGYTVDATENLSDWTVIAPRVESTSQETTHTETGIPADASRRFYRIRRL
jgi:hypothetical protein